ncbi:MAG: 2,4-dihydroxyhept-2-ene-1,7-dioic acid aldolase [Rhodospirillaceae bacterium]|nr:2,4-dihydroxyhept-2-ene-1,7-dioic acid aldolase [Rhodospirillaceae bacterium]|tara:strand:- start:20582 stop:21304 length:723 start_codon:yes stop_codon:yes gene_type:complete
MPMAFWLEADNPHACEIAARAGFDIVILDMEHGMLDLVHADRLIPFCIGLGMTVYSRVAEPERAPIQHALDSGADGVILPQIRNAEHAAEVTAFAKYPPLGTRGLGWNRTMGYGGTPRTWPRQRNKTTVCYAQIETLGGLAEAEAIARLKTVDGLFLGPSDMSMARGRGPNRWTQADLDDLKTVAAAARDAGKLFATTGAENSVSRRAGRAVKADFMTAGDDLSAMVAGFDHLIQAARGR